LLLLQVSVAVPPGLTVLGVAWMLTVGTGRVTEMVADCVADPPGPLQVSSNSVLRLSSPVDDEPLVDTAPLQPPLLVHAVAPVVVHVKFDTPP